LYYQGFFINLFTNKENIVRYGVFHNLDNLFVFSAHIMLYNNNKYPIDQNILVDKINGDIQADVVNCPAGLAR